MIPKKIHYIWFGGNPKPELIQKCIASWHRFFPNYEIIEWNESNYDINQCEYVRQAYAEKKWAFASDYARFDILYQHGGIYLDTDVEFLKSLPEKMLEHEAFIGFESGGNIAPGLIYGAVPGFPLNWEILDAYRSAGCNTEGKVEFKTVNVVTSEVLRKHAEIRPNQFQVINGLALFPSTYFCGYDLDVGEYDIRSETISVHHYAGSWLTSGTKRKLQVILKKILGIPMYRKLLTVKRWFFGIHGARSWNERRLP